MKSHFHIFKYCFLATAFFSYNLLLSQSNIRPFPNFIGQSIESVLKNDSWEILVKAEGDLNYDSKADLVLVLQSKDSINEVRYNDTKVSKNKPRIILVCLDLHGIKRVNIQNNRFIARGNEGGMSPYIEPEISIKENTLTIYYQYTRGNQSYTFEFLDHEFLLTHAESHDVMGATGDYETHIFDFKNKTIFSEYGNISEEKNKSENLKLEVELKSLTDFGEMYEWQVAENLYL